MTRDNTNIGKRKNTMTKTLIDKVGIKEVEKLWIQYGCYRAAEKLSELLEQYISFSTIRYLSQVCSWKRPVNPKSAIYVGVKKGTIPASFYKHLIFPEEMRDEKNTIKSMEEILRDTQHNKKLKEVFLKLLAKQRKPKNPFDEVRSYTPPSMSETKPGGNPSDTI